MHWTPIGQSLSLIFIANGVPLAAKLLLGCRFDHPIDLDATGIDGQPLLGRSKTIRGLVLSLSVTTALAPAIGLSWMFGLSIAGSAMAGDLLTQAASWLGLNANIKDGLILEQQSCSSDQGETE